MSEPQLTKLNFQKQYLFNGYHRGSDNFLHYFELFSNKITKKLKKLDIALKNSFNKPNQGGSQ